MTADTPPGELQGELVLLATAKGAWELDEDAAPLRAALAARGITAEPAVWDDPAVDWAAASLVVVRSTWDYVERRHEFLAWARRVAASSELCNPTDVLEWNTDKAYLGELADAGLPVVPTVFVAPVDLADPVTADAALRAAASQLDEPEEIVIKPSVSAGSRDTLRVGLHDGDTDEVARAIELTVAIGGSGRTVMVQPYLASVDEVDETGLVHFDGELSHAFAKGPLLARSGPAVSALFALERIAPRRPDPAEVALGRAVVDHLGERFGPLLYARVDLLAGDDGPVVLEVELTEPSWFLATDPAAAGRAAAAIAGRVRRAGR